MVFITSFSLGLGISIPPFCLMGSPGFCSLCRFRLSESFRFGPEIAACANALLNFADGGHSRSVRVVGSGPRGEVVKHGERSRDRSGTTVFIARSNKGQNGVWGYDRFERIERLEEVYHDYNYGTILTQLSRKCTSTTATQLLLIVLK